MMNRYGADDSPANETMMCMNNEGFPETEEKEELCPLVGAYACYLRQWNKGYLTWYGMWHIRDYDANYVVLDVYSGEYTYRLEVESCANGHYLCIPEWNVSCLLSQDLRERSRNYRSLAKTMEPFHVLGIVRALEDLSRKTGWGHR